MKILLTRTKGSAINMDGISNEEAIKRGLSNINQVFIDAGINGLDLLYLGSGTGQGKNLGDYKWWELTVNQDFIDEKFKDMFPPKDGKYHIVLSPNRIKLIDLESICKTIDERLIDSIIKKLENGRPSDKETLFLEHRIRNHDKDLYWLKDAENGIKYYCPTPRRQNLDERTGNIHIDERQPLEAPIVQASLCPGVREDEAKPYLYVPKLAEKTFIVIRTNAQFGKGTGVTYIPKDRYFPRIEDQDPHTGASVEELLIGLLSQILRKESKSGLEKLL